MHDSALKLGLLDLTTSSSQISRGRQSMPKSDGENHQKNVRTWK